MSYPTKLLAAIVPVIAYWLFTGLYELLAYALRNARLHPKEDEYKKNALSGSTVTKAVLTQQTALRNMLQLISRECSSHIHSLWGCKRELGSA